MKPSLFLFWKSALFAGACLLAASAMLHAAPAKKNQISFSSSPTISAGRTSAATAVTFTRPRTLTAWPSRACVSPMPTPPRRLLADAREHPDRKISSPLRSHRLVARPQGQSLAKAQTLRHPALPAARRNHRRRGVESRRLQTAFFGKWHLGDSPEHWAEHQGFDLNLGGCGKGTPPSYFSPYKLPNLPDGPDGEYLTDRLTSEAIGFIEQNRDKPFLVYLSHYAVHNPLQAKPGLLENTKPRPPNSPLANPLSFLTTTAAP